MWQTIKSKRFNNDVCSLQNKNKTRAKARNKMQKGEAMSHTSKAALLTTSAAASPAALMASRGALASLASASADLTAFFTRSEISLDPTLHYPLFPWENHYQWS